MNKKKLIIGGIIIILIVVVSVFLLRDTKTPRAVQETPGVFPSANDRPDSTTLPPGSTNTGSNQTSNTAIKSSSRLVSISKKPIAGYVAFTDIGASSTIIRFAERETGHIYEYLPIPRELSRISNTTIPGIQEAIWAHSGEYVALRYFDGKKNTVKTFIANIVLGQSSTSTLDGKYLDNDIASIAVAPPERTAGERFVIVEKNIPDAVVDTLEFSGVKRSRLLTLPVPEWQVSWPASGRLLFTTSPSGGALGFTYLYDVARGSAGNTKLERILGPYAGLTAIGNSNGTLILFSYVQNRGIATKVFNTRTKSQTSLGIATLAEKCAFSALHPTIAYCAAPFFLPPALYPDAWYQGISHFSDMIWKIDTTTGTVAVVVYPEREVGESIDAVELSVDPDDSFLYFKDKTSGLLWQLKL